MVTPEHDVVAHLYAGVIKNITEQAQRVNIRIKFYDIDENCIGETQSGENTVIDEDADALVVRPNEILSASFNFYDEDLDEGHSFSDIAYISIEDIIFS